MILTNRTKLATDRLETLFRQSVEDWPTEGLAVTVRPSRSSEFSAACYYRTDRIYLNLGQRLEYPYRISTHLARAQSNRRCWWREAYFLTLADAYQLALFLFRHEFYHWLVYRARRNRRQKEAMCDRFAARGLVDGFGAIITDNRGLEVPRDRWDFQDLDAFVAAARRRRDVGSMTARPAVGARHSTRRAAG